MLESRVEMAWGGGIMYKRGGKMKKADMKEVVWKIKRLQKLSQVSQYRTYVGEIKVQFRIFYFKLT